MKCKKRKSSKREELAKELTAVTGTTEKPGTFYLHTEQPTRSETLSDSERRKSRNRKLQVPRV